MKFAATMPWSCTSILLLLKIHICFLQEEGQWDEHTQASYFTEGMEGEPEMPVNIPPEVDPQVSLLICISNMHIIPL